MKRTLFVLTASLGLAVAAPATMLTLNCTGTFGPMTTLGGTVFGADTPFSYHATFDSTTDVYGNPDQGVFPITSFSIVLPSGTYTAAPQADLNVLLNHTLPAQYSAGLSTTDATVGPGRFFCQSYSAATPDFSADAPTPSVISHLVSRTYTAHYTITLNGGAGDLVIEGPGSSSFTAEIAPVPEPGAWAMMGLTFCGVAGYTIRRRPQPANQRTEA